MLKITDSDKKILERFPEYNGKPEDYVNSRDYWENIFRSETNREPELHEAFSKLHEDIVNMVIQFCKEHNLNNIDEFHVSADGLIGSVPFGKWCACTDSSMSLIKAEKDEHGWVMSERDTPFLYQI